MNNTELKNLLDNYNINIDDVKQVLNAICFDCLSCDFNYYLNNSKYYKAMILLLELYSSKVSKYVNSQFIYDEILDDFGIESTEIENLY